MASNYDYEQELQEYYKQCEDNLARLKDVENSWGNKKNDILKTQITEWVLYWQKLLWEEKVAKAARFSLQL